MVQGRLLRCYSRCWVYIVSGKSILTWDRNPVKFLSHNPGSWRRRLRNTFRSCCRPSKMPRVPLRNYGREKGKLSRRPILSTRTTINNGGRICPRISANFGMNIFHCLSPMTEYVYFHPPRDWSHHSIDSSARCSRMTSGRGASAVALTSPSQHASLGTSHHLPRAQHRLGGLGCVRGRMFCPLPITCNSLAEVLSPTTYFWRPTGTTFRKPLLGS